MVQIALTDTRSTAQPDTTMNHASSAAANTNTAPDPDVGAVEHAARRRPRRGPRSERIARDRAVGLPAAHRRRPGRAASADAVDDVPEVPQLQRFSHRVGDQAGGQRSDLPSGQPDAAVVGGGLGDGETDPAPERQQPVRAVHQPGGIGEDGRPTARACVSAIQDHRPAAAGLAAPDGDHADEHPDRHRDQQQTQRGW